MSDCLESMDLLTEMVNHLLVVDITIIGKADDEDDINVNLSMIDSTAIFGVGKSLPKAIQDAFAKFEIKLNKDRN